MKITTWNVNGIRAREEQVLELVQRDQPDVVCLQEIKASPGDVPPRLCALENYWCYWHGHKGYSGVGINLRKDLAPAQPQFFHPSFDMENRIVAVRLGEYLIASIYVPNGNKNLPAKITFLEEMAKFAEAETAKGTKLILCGDMNVAYEDRDVHPTMQKPGQIGTTPEERALMKRIFDCGLVDLLRKFDPDNDRLFTWWAPWRNFRQKNYGWRLDYVLVPPSLAELAKGCTVNREFGTSDHGPVTAELELDLSVGSSPSPSEVHSSAEPSTAVPSDSSGSVASGSQRSGEDPAAAATQGRPKQLGLPL